jgi:hypothetical protein
MISMDMSQYQAPNITPVGIFALAVGAFILWKVLK